MEGSALVILADLEANFEKAWVTFLNSIPEWDRRTVFKHEIEWHDNVASGEWSWNDLMTAMFEAQR